MKTWQRICSVLVTTLLILALTIIVNGIIAWNHPCSLCNAMRYHAPCLVDLETGTVTELSIYDPHPFLTGELADEQYTTGTFSLLTCGKAQGYKDTTQKRIEITIPQIEMSSQVLLCASCVEKFNVDNAERYLLMDLYDKEMSRSFSLTEQTVVIRCYEISIERYEMEIKISLQGLLE